MGTDRGDMPTERTGDHHDAPGPPNTSTHLPCPAR